jgi:predicted nucleic acid-binding protein
LKCLDTSFLIDMLRNDAGAVKKARELDEAGPSATTEVNVFELVYGVHRGKLADRRARLAQLERLFSRLITLPLNHEAALKAGEVLGVLAREGKEVSVLDGLAALIALVHGCEAIVTRNVERFKNMPVQIEIY